MTVLSSVRGRITALATAAVLTVLVGSAIGLVAQQQRVLVENLDESLQLRARELLELGDAVPRQITGLGEDDTMAQVVVSGEVVAASPNAAGLDPVAPRPPRAGERVTTVEQLPHEDGRFRVVARVDDDGRLVIVAGTLDDIEESTTVLRRSLLVSVPLVVSALALVVWWLVGRALRPVEAIRSQVAAIGAGALDRRVPEPTGDDEVARLARTMNEMLDRLERSAARQRRFTADASHELRSPLARMRAELEVDLAHPDQADLLATHRSTLDEAVRLQRLADDLLLVARSDEEALPTARHERVDLDDLVGRVARRLRADGRVVVDLSRVSAAQVAGDPDELARLVGNLADNAVRHATSRVSFTVTESGTEALLVVADDGPGVPPSDRERIFERFARVDEARTVERGGTGLGLAIARDIAERHGGTLDLEDADARDGASFVVRLPLAT